MRGGGSYAVEKCLGGECGEGRVLITISDYRGEEGRGIKGGELLLVRRVETQVPGEGGVKGFPGLNTKEYSTRGKERYSRFRATSGPDWMWGLGFRV